MALLSFLSGTLRRRRKLRMVCPYCEGKLRTQAADLLDAGYFVAAVATSRCEIEAKIKEITLWVVELRHLRAASGKTPGRIFFLFQQGIVSADLMKRVNKYCNRAARAIHDNVVNCMRARWIVSEGASLIEELERQAIHSIRGEGGAL